MHSLAKQANGAPQSMLNQEALQTVLNLGLAGLGAGAVGRGLSGFKSMLFPQGQDVTATSSVPQELPIRIFQHAPKPPVEQAYDDDQAQQQQIEAIDNPDVSSVPPDAVDAGPETALAAEGGMPADADLAPDGMPKLASLTDANPTGGVTWWQVPAGLTAAGLGVYGGWQGLDALLGKKRQGDLTGDMEEAQREYEQALQDQFLAVHPDPQPGQKAAGDHPYAGLDSLFDAMEKKAVELGYEMPVDVGSMVPDVVKDVGHGAGGAYATAALISALGSGYAGFNWARKRSQSKMIEEALKRRARARAAPQPLYATADPTVA